MAVGAAGSGLSGCADSVRRSVEETATLGPALGCTASRQQQIALATLPTPVILSGTERRRREVKSKDPEVVSFAMQLQGILTKIPIRSSVHSKYCLRISSLLSLRSPIPLLSPPPPFQHSGPRQTNKLFPCNLSRRKPPCPRLFPASRLPFLSCSRSAHAALIVDSSNRLRRRHLHVRACQ